MASMILLDLNSVMQCDEKKMKCWMGIYLAMFKVKFGNFIFLSVLTGDSDVTLGQSKLSIYSF